MDILEAGMQVLDTGLELRSGDQRGTLSNDWLHARFSFSFGGWVHPRHQGFGPLRALNEDVVQPATGFGMHGHRDLDIFMLPLSGEVEHRDSLGHVARVRPGQVQRMFAGSGIRHSQMNVSTADVDHHLQIWLKPRRAGGTPSVEARDFDLFGRPGGWCFVVSPDGRDGSFVFDGDAWMATTRVHGRHVASWRPRAGSMVYLHTIDGHGVAAVGTSPSAFRMGPGDALAIQRADGEPLRLESKGPAARWLVFEFAPAAAG